ncbi:tetratricopeptide repeat protein [Streptomyces sp. SYSU K217416]
MTAPTPQDIQQAIWENFNAPNGLPRNARAEELVAAAEGTGDRDLVRQALFGLVKAYEYSSERGKLAVPFARLMQEWDRDPSAFDGHDTYRFHWYFKWVTSGMLTLPQIPLASMERWLVEMERRYRIAGYSERAVRQAEFDLADETGDTERAARAFAAWTAAERDQMANCHACETNDQGHYWARQGQDAKALKVWKPVLDGRLTCAEEPHRTLAKALIPLVRTGRADEARAHHLRGYRLARGDDSLLPTIGLHIEFCALTGNEGRGLEILAEHAAHLAHEGNPSARLELFTGALVLLRRLTGLGHGDRPALTYGGRARTVAELHDVLAAEANAIAAAFDARNGSNVVSGRFAARLAAEPLIAELPLGVRAVRFSPAPAATGAGAEVGASSAALAERDADVPALAAEARRLRTAGHPGVGAAWARVRAALAGRGERPDGGLATELLEDDALNAARAGADGARELLEQVAAAYREAGEHSRAALNAVRLVYAAVQTDADPAEIRELADAAEREAAALAPDDPTRARRVAHVALTRVRLTAYLDHPTHGRDEGPGGGNSGGEQRVVAALDAFIADASAAPPADGLGDLVADAEATAAQFAWQARDWERAETLLSSAAARSLGAGRPWDAVEPLTRLARLLLMLGRAGDAEEPARAAVTHSAEVVEAHELGSVRLALAEALYQQDGKEAEAADYALEAAHWFDAADESAGAGAYARLVLARAYLETGRKEEAAEILESALPDLVEHGAEQAVQARDVLARSLRELGDHRAAAEQYLLAAEVTRDWEYPHAQARLAALAGECLAAAGLRDQAAAAYGRSVELWRAAGEPVPLVRVLRALAWLRVDSDETDPVKAVAAARDLMGQAVQVLEAGDPADPQLLLERGRTWSQLAELLTDHFYDDEEDERDEEDAQDARVRPGEEEAARIRQEALELWERAVEAFTACGAEALRERAQTVCRAAWLERDLGRPEAGVARLTALIDELSDQDTDEARGLLRSLEQDLNHLT